VQVITPITAAVTPDAAGRLVCDFAAESAPWIAGLFTDHPKNENREGILESAREGSVCRTEP
jgi:hypothetical protein